MPEKTRDTNRYQVSFNEAFKLIFRYVRNRITEQIKAVSTMIVFLVFFQTLVLGIPLMDASVIALGMVLVILGLTFFLEGLLLGIMPLGQVIGLKLPKKINLSFILIIAFILGLGATFAEPAIGVLKIAGQSVKAWDAPLLFIFLNKYSNFLVYAIGVGVGFAVVIGTLRFFYGWSLKPLIIIIVTLLVGLSFYSYTNSNLAHILGLAWDCGGVTTGPVTVPLILALGMGISHVARKSDEKSGQGFGVVTLASLLPIIAVLIIAIVVEPKVPEPMTVDEFVTQTNRPKAEYMFDNPDIFKGYILKNTDYDTQLALFDNDIEKLVGYAKRINSDEAALTAAFDTRTEFERWIVTLRNEELLTEVFGSEAKLEEIILPQSARNSTGTLNMDFIIRNVRSAAQSIIPLSLFLLLILILVIRERLAKADEVILGVGFAIIGLSIFYGGIELGLAKIGDQVGSNLPASFTQIDIPEEQIIINDFDYDSVQRAIVPKGEIKQFFYLYKHNNYTTVNYQDENYLQDSRQYIYTPARGPLFGGKEHSFAGLLVVFIFAFLVGYAATLAEPALFALGLTVEEITIGTFKKSLLIQTVAIGVGCGIAAGVAKIVWNLPLFWMLIPAYMLLLIITILSAEDYVNIAWDAAGVTTGPITVPLVITMGLGISSQVGVVEGFGILALASVCPIFAVLSVGLVVDYKRNKNLREISSDGEKIF